MAQKRGRDRFGTRGNAGNWRAASQWRPAIRSRAIDSRHRFNACSWAEFNANPATYSLYDCSTYRGIRHAIITFTLAERYSRQASAQEHLSADDGQSEHARPAGRVDYQSRRHDRILPRHLRGEHLMGRMDRSGAAAASLRSAAGLCVLAFHLEHDSDPAHAA